MEVKVEYKINRDTNEKVNIKDLIWLNRCACCGFPNPTTKRQRVGAVTINSQRTGSRNKIIWLSWVVPYCSVCLTHDTEKENEKNIFLERFGVLSYRRSLL